MIAPVKRPDPNRVTNGREWWFNSEHKTEAGATAVYSFFTDKNCAEKWREQIHNAFGGQEHPPTRLTHEGSNWKLAVYVDDPVKFDAAMEKLDCAALGIQTAPTAQCLDPQHGADEPSPRVRTYRPRGVRGA